MRPRLHDKRLYWRGSVIWCRVLGQLGTIERCTTKCRSEDAAVAVANELERRAADPTYAAASKTTLGGVIRGYLADLDRRGRADATKEIARRKVGHFVRVWGEAMPIVRVTAQLVLDYIDQRQREQVTDHTIKLELGHLRQMLKIARHVGTFHEETSRILPPFFSAKHTPRKRWPTPDEMGALVAELEPRRAAHIVYILATGARASEARRALRSDADFTRRVVHVHGKKTELSDDDVPITLVNEPLLRWALERAPGKTLLFHPWGKLNRDLASACERAKIPRLSPNDLRRGFARWHLLAGVDIQHISRMLRHATDKLAQTTYARATGEEIGALAAPQIRDLPTVRFLYPAAAAEVCRTCTDPTAKDDVNSTHAHAVSATNAAPPVEFESTTSALGKPQFDTVSGAELSVDGGLACTAVVSELYARGPSKTSVIREAVDRYVASEWEAAS